MKIYMIRHGKAEYTYGDKHNFIGHGHDLAKLDNDFISDVIKTSKDERLTKAQLIVSSPYTRALQTAAIISKETDLDIEIEHDLREWEPDKTYTYKANEIKELYKEYIAFNGIHPKEKNTKWESKEDLKKRILSVIDKYKNYECVIFVYHQMAMQTILKQKEIKPAEMIEYDTKKESF